MPEWMERELARELSPVDAPDDLWLRIRDGRGKAPVRKSRPQAFLVAAAAMLLVTAGAIWLWGSPARNPVPQVSAQGSCYACHTSL